MCHAYAFLKGLYVTTLPILNYTTSNLVTITQTARYVPPTKPGTLKFLLSNLLFCTPAALSCLLNAGHRTPYSLAHQCVQQDTMSDRMRGVEVQYSYRFLLTYFST
jgi:hypothetical protein